MTAPATGLIGAEVGLALTGLGMGFATGPLMGTGSEPFLAARSGTAAALINVARMAGATIGVAVLGAVFVVGGGEFERTAPRNAARRGASDRRRRVCLEDAMRPIIKGFG